MYSSSGTITLRGCYFFDSQVDEGEGGAVDVSSPDGTIVVENNDFIGNYMEYGDGVGVYIWGDTVTVTGNTFMNNAADGEYYYGGGGANIDGDYVVVNNNTFTGNSSGSSSEGGGACIYGYYSLIMMGNDFNNNTADYDGGGALVEGRGDITMTNNVFTDNTGGEGGGADIAVYGGLLMVNNVFADNTANNNGGGGVNQSLWPLTSPASVTNNTFTMIQRPRAVAFTSAPGKAPIAYTFTTTLFLATRQPSVETCT